MINMGNRTKRTNVVTDLVCHLAAFFSQLVSEFALDIWIPLRGLLCDKASIPISALSKSLRKQIRAARSSAEAKLVVVDQDEVWTRKIFFFANGCHTQRESSRI